MAALLLIAGLFSVVSAACDWDWYMEHSKSRLWVSLFGRGGARIFYVLLGILLATAGLLGLMGLVNLE